MSIPTVDGIETAPVVLKAKREKPVRQGHPWIFSGAVERFPKDVPDGAIVSVVSTKGEWLAWGYINRRSQISVRLLSWIRDETIDEHFWRRRLHAAAQRRQELVEDHNTTAYRLINAESDFLPGLTVDRYGDYLVLQAGTLAIDTRKEWLAKELIAITGALAVFERSEGAARSHEGLGPSAGLLTGSLPDAPIVILENGLQFRVDLRTGQKTGFYLDQRDNRQRVAAYCAGRRVLNAFSYTGGFGIYALAAGAEHVTNVDTSTDALALAEENTRLNGFEPSACTTSVAGDLFQYLRQSRWAAGASGASLPEAHDVIVLDPPKFAQSKRGIEKALRGYKEINMMAMKMLPANGILATFSCSGLVSAELFQKVVFGAAVDAGRSVQIIEWLRQGPDHPVAITFPEGEYLSGLICRVV